VSEPEWLERARAFRADDPDPDTQRELDQLLAAVAPPTAAWAHPAGAARTSRTLTAATLEDVGDPAPGATRTVRNLGTAGGPKALPAAAIRTVRNLGTPAPGGANAAPPAAVSARLDDNLGTAAPGPNARAAAALRLDDTLTREAAQRELEERFGSQITFGTAGLRGLLGAGDNRMNRRVVALTTAALCAELASTVPDAARRGLCVGFDGRHKSREFAEEVQAVANGAGFVVHAFGEPTATPLLAFAVLQLAAAAGVMVTASHNPAAYNGYKVYWANGAQLNAPHDRAISDRIATGPKALTLRRLPLAAARQAGLWHTLAAIEDEYFAKLELRLEPTTSAGRAPRFEAPEPRLEAAAGAGGERAPRVAYTAMHGVGERFARRALAVAGVSELDSVTEQAVPDPEFPTVQFPNPEEPGALDLLLALGERTRAELALANDPDADRLAAAVRDHAGTLRALTGNELGVLLCDYLLQQAPQDGKNCVVTTLVSTPLLAAIARAHGARLEITLTGFKWIIRRALELEQSGLRFVLGFEEALGYCIGDLVRDKDGISAAAYVARMNQWHSARGVTLSEALDEVYVRHGLYESRQVSLTLGSDAAVQALRARISELRRAPPTRIAGLAVSHFEDLLQPGPHSLPKSDVLRFELAGRHRLTIRPSGTEPKLKIYLDCSAPIAQRADLEAARAQLHAQADHIEHAIRDYLTAAAPRP
jgi:phosphomannomutase